VVSPNQTRRRAEEEAHVRDVLEALGGTRERFERSRRKPVSIAAEPLAIRVAAQTPGFLIEPRKEEPPPAEPVAEPEPEPAAVEAPTLVAKPVLAIEGETALTPAPRRRVPKPAAEPAVVFEAVVQSPAPEPEPAVAHRAPKPRRRRVPQPVEEPAVVIEAEADDPEPEVAPPAPPPKPRRRTPKPVPIEKPVPAAEAVEATVDPAPEQARRRLPKVSLAARSRLRRDDRSGDPAEPVVEEERNGDQVLSAEQRSRVELYTMKGPEGPPAIPRSASSSSGRGSAEARGSSFRPPPGRSV